MAIRLGLVLLLLATAVVADSSLHDAYWGGVARVSDGGDGGIGALQTCNGLVGDCIDEDEEMMMESESTRRTLRRRRYISYGALRRNVVPCNRRGNSYYNCNYRKRANPYRRGCNVITRQFRLQPNKGNNNQYRSNIKNLPRVTLRLLNDTLLLIVPV
ncbi:hypothetical protein RJ640_004440 [Escallonia rubra]|uniref:Rapid alkalinization factor n=1 Tax=Escallonia rubra TaxID=112253 RepID=A0AA88QDL7_9ASTE|nr:hypothetical protein RJ640_004440 [Escallonia rubra]